MVEKAYNVSRSKRIRYKNQLFIINISHVDYKNMMENFKKGAPKQMLKEGLEKEGNAFTAGLAKAKKGQEFKVGGKAVKDTSNYDASMDESHPANDQWHEDFQAAILAMGLAGEAEARVMKALNHTDPLTQYGNMPAAQAAAEFVDDLGIADDYDDYEPDTDADYEEPRDDFDMAGDFNDGEFWENEIKKLQEIAGIKKEGTAPVRRSWLNDDPEQAAEDRETIESYVVTSEEYENASERQIRSIVNRLHNEWDSARNEDEYEYPNIETFLKKKHSELFREELEFADDYKEDPQAAKDARAKKMEMDDEEAENAEIDEEANPNKSYHGSTANQGDTGWTIDFTVIENTPEYFKIDYVMTPNSGRAPMGASRNYRPEKKYGEWKISKVGSKGQPLTDYEKTQLNIKGDHFGVNGKEFVQDIYGDVEGLSEDADSNRSVRDPLAAAKNVANKYRAELKPKFDEYQESYEEYMQAIRQYDNKDPKFREIAAAHNALVKAFQGNALGLARQEMEDAGEKSVVAKNLAYGYSDEDWPSEFVTALNKELKGTAEDLNEFGGHGDTPDSPKLQAAAEFLVQNRDRYLTQEYFSKHGIRILSSKSDKELYDYIVNNMHSDEVYDTVADMKSQKEGLHMPPLQATGQTIVTNEDQAPFGMSVLSPDERKQLKEYINSYRTIKSEISKLLSKTGKSGEIMENAKKAEDETVPAERKAKYKDPTTVPTQHKHSNLGGDRTNLVMTKAEMWENEEHEEGAHERIESMLDVRLHDAFHKVTGMVIKDLMDGGFDEGDIKNFLQHEIDEKAKEAINAQHDF